MRLQGMYFATMFAAVLPVTGAVAAPAKFAPLSAPTAAPERDPLEAILRSLHLARRAKVATISTRGSCEPGEVAAMLRVEHVTALERDDPGTPAPLSECSRASSVDRIVWPTPPIGEADIPVHDLDLVWITSSSYQSLSAVVTPAQMAGLLRTLASSIAPSGALIITGRLAILKTRQTPAAQANEADPQVVLDQLEGAGLRLQSFANNASNLGNEHPFRPANRFVMLFRPKSRLIAR